MIGGPNDILIEPTIRRGVAQAQRGQGVPMQQAPAPLPANLHPREVPPPARSPEPAPPRVAPSPLPAPLPASLPAEPVRPPQPANVAQRMSGAPSQTSQAPSPRSDAPAPARPDASGRGDPSPERRSPSRRACGAQPPPGRRSRRHGAQARRGPATPPRRRHRAGASADAARAGGFAREAHARAAKAGADAHGSARADPRVHAGTRARAPSSGRSAAETASAEPASTSARAASPSRADAFRFDRGAKVGRGAREAARAGDDRRGEQGDPTSSPSPTQPTVAPKNDAPDLDLLEAEMAKLLGRPPLPGEQGSYLGATQIRGPVREPLARPPNSPRAGVRARDGRFTPAMRPQAARGIPRALRKASMPL